MTLLLYTIPRGSQQDFQARLKILVVLKPVLDWREVLHVLDSPVSLGGQDFSKKVFTHPVDSVGITLLMKFPKMALGAKSNKIIEDVSGSGAGTIVVDPVVDMEDRFRLTLQAYSATPPVPNLHQLTAQVPYPLLRPLGQDLSDGLLSFLGLLALESCAV